MGKGEKDRNPEDAVGHRIEDLAQFCHLILAPSSHPVEDIGQLGKDDEAKENEGERDETYPQFGIKEVDEDEDRA